EEILYPALEDYEVDIVIGQGPGARTVKVPVERFTLIGATTRTGLLTSPLRSRFGISHRLEFYTPTDLEEIVRRSAKILGVPIDDKFGGGPVGLGTIAAAISEEKDAIEDIYEPFLIQIGFLDRTPRGRVATPLAYGYFGLIAPDERRRESRLW